MKTNHIAVIGDGGWGTALALVLNGNGHRVSVWGPFADYVAEVQKTRVNRKFLPGVTLPEAISFTADRAVASTADVAVLPCRQSSTSRS